MNTRRDPDRLIHDFLMEGGTELADEVYVTVRDRIEATRQRAVIGSWREPDVNRYLKFALAAAAVLAIAVVGYRQFGSADVTGSGPSVSPAPTSTPTATPTPSVAVASPSASVSAPPLTETFTSERHGITISYPNGWVTRPATEPWTTGYPDFINPTAGDILHDPVRRSNLWIMVASQPIGDSTPDDWVAEKLTRNECTVGEPIAVDGAIGRIGADHCSWVAVTTDGRGYLIWLYTSFDEPSLPATYDRAWFEEVLATVQLQPEDADVAPSASP